jgi:uncharacterized membrane protein
MSNSVQTFLESHAPPSVLRSFHELIESYERRIRDLSFQNATLTCANQIKTHSEREFTAACNRADEAEIALERFRSKYEPLGTLLSPLDEE